jgi:hypothetical protein
MRTILVLSALLLSFPVSGQERKKADPQVQRGRYLVQIAGCNDCHTPRYPESGGKVAESEWLTGDALGWRGCAARANAERALRSVPGAA